jgi:sialate O-acetylesterase
LKFALASALAALLLAAQVHGDVKPASIFQPGMVLQQGAPTSVWGTAKPGARITVKFAGLTKAATAERDGRWRVTLGPMPASSKPATMTITGDGQVEIADVLVGDVWIVAGGRTVASSGKAADSALPVRAFKAEPAAAFDPAREIAGKWHTEARYMATLARLIGSDLSEATKTPVGLIVIARDTPIETWISRGALESADPAKPILEFYAGKNWDKQRAAAQQGYEQRLADWKKKGQDLPFEPADAPQRDEPSGKDAIGPSAVYNASIAPLAGLAVRGVVWDHGDDDPSTIHAAQYGKLLPVLIADWRKQLGSAQLPWVIVQRRAGRNRLYDDRAGAEMREGQLQAAKAAGAKLVVTVDLGVDAAAAVIAERVAAAAIGASQGTSAGADGPMFESATASGDRMIVKFTNTGGGIEAKGDKVRGVTLLDGNGRWVWADVEIRGEQLIASAPGVAKPLAVRYAWQDLPERGANLYGKSGLPVGPFRSDDHAGVTDKVVSPSDAPRHSLISELYIEDPHLPRVLIIGDSIAGGHIEPLRKLLARKANVLIGNSHKGVGIYTTSGALRNDTLAKLLNDRGPFDVIQFNMGIHEFAGSRNPEADAKAYAQRLEQVVKVFKASGAHLIWCSSSGAPADGLIERFPLYLSAATAYNAAALEIMKKHDVTVSDLFAFSQPQITTLQGGDHIHFTGEAKQKIGEFLLPNIERGLAGSKPRR